METMFFRKHYFEQIIVQRYGKIMKFYIFNKSLRDGELCQILLGV